jgi:CcmD family protein
VSVPGTSWSNGRGLVRASLLALGLLLACAPAVPQAWAQDSAQPPRAAQDEFVPIDTLPPDEQLPAAPLVLAAYGAAWLIILAYVWSLWRRLGRVEQEIASLGRRTAGRAP